MFFFSQINFFIEAGFTSFEPGFPEKLFVFSFWSLHCAGDEHSLLLRTVEMSALRRQLSGVSAGEDIPASQSVAREMMTQNNLLISTHIRRAWQLHKVYMKGH